MASILSSTRADPLFEAGVAPTLAKGRSADVEDALARLAHHAVSDMPDPELFERACDRPGNAGTSHVLGAATQGYPGLGHPGLGPVVLGPADLSAQFPREPRSLGKRGILARVAVAVVLGACAIWAWRAYGGPTRDMMATWGSPFGWISARPAADQATAPKMADAAAGPAAAPPAVATSATPPAQAPSQSASLAQPATTAAAPADRQQIATMARDIAALRQTIDRLAAGQEKLTRELTKLETEKAQAEKPPIDKPQADRPAAEKPAKRVQRRVSGPGGADVFDPAQNPTAPGVPRSLGSIVQHR